MLLLLLMLRAREVLRVEKLLQFLAVLDLDSEFRLGVETEEDGTAHFTAGDADDLD
jgi:hypothetical protein